MTRTLSFLFALCFSAIAAASGGLSAASATKVAKSHEDEAQACYAAGKSRNAELAGRVALDLVIEPGGQVKRANATPTPRYTDKASLACLVDAAKGWRFPKGSAPLSVTVAFTFGDISTPPPEVAAPVARRQPPAPAPPPAKPAAPPPDTTKNDAPLAEPPPLPPAEAPPVDAAPGDAPATTTASPPGDNGATPPPQ